MAEFDPAKLEKVKAEFDPAKLAGYGTDTPSTSSVDYNASTEEVKPSIGGFFEHMRTKSWPAIAGRTAAQIPLGAGREMVRMVRDAAPAALAESYAMNPRLNLPQEDNSLFGEESKTPEALTPKPYQKPAEEFKKAIGMEGVMTPRNTAERMASAAGEALPWAPLGAGPEGVLPMMAIQGIGGAGGQAAEEAFPSLGPWGKVLGSVVSALGAEGVINAVTRAARPKEFGIPLTKGQRMLSEEDPRAMAQVGLEEDIRKGGKGLPAQVIMNKFDQSQDAAARTAIEEAGEGLGGLKQTTTEAGDTVKGALSTEAKGRQDLANKYYESAAERMARVDIGTSDALVRDIRGALDDAGFTSNILNITSHPQASRMLSLIERASQNPDYRRYGMTTQEMEAIRKQFVKIFPNPRTDDGVAAAIIKSAYDDWEHNVVANKLIKGDPKALEDLTEARNYWKLYKDMTGRTKGADAVIAKIINGDHTPEQVANLVINASSVGGGSLAAGVVSRIKSILGNNSESVKSLRQAVFNKLTENAAKVSEGVVDTSRSSIDTSRQIKKFLHHENSRALARELFTQEERLLLDRLANQLGRTTPKQVNPPGSGSTSARLALPLAQAFGGLGIGAAGHYYTGSPYAYALAATPWIRDANAVRQAIKATKDKMPNNISKTRTLFPLAVRTGHQNLTEDNQ